MRFEITFGKFSQSCQPLKISNLETLFFALNRPHINGNPRKWEWFWILYEVLEVQKSPRNRTMKKKNLNSGKNFQPKGQKSSEVDFIPGDLVTHLGEQEIGAM